MSRTWPHFSNDLAAVLCCDVLIQSGWPALPGHSKCECTPHSNSNSRRYFQPHAWRMAAWYAVVVLRAVVSAAGTPSYNSFHSPSAQTTSGEHSSMSHTLVTSFFTGFLLPFQADLFLLCFPSVFFTDGHVPSSHHIFNFLSNNFHGFSTSISISHVIQFNKCLGYEILHQALRLTSFSMFITNIFWWN